MATTSQSRNRARSLVSHIKHLAGVEPLMARQFIDGSCDAARERLGIRPAGVKRSRRTTREGRHIVIKVGDKTTGEADAPQLVRRRNLRTGRHTFVQVTDKAASKRARRRKPIRVYQWTADQVGKILKEAKPRKKEYKAIKAAALAALEGKPKVHRLPRHKKWSKRRNRR